MRLLRLAALGLAAALAAGCGEILEEIDRANDLAGKPSGNRPAPAAGRAPANAAAPPSGAPPPRATAETEGETGPGLVSRVESWLGLGGDQPSGRRPPDPNDPMVLCRLDGSTGFMLKSGCINRRGTVVANKGVPR